MIDQAALVRRIRVAITAIPNRWTTLWEGKAVLNLAPPYMTVQVAISDGAFVSNAQQERISGLINFGFVVAFGDSSLNSRAEEEAARVGGFMRELPGVRLLAPPQLLDGVRDGERWRVGLLVRWEQLP